MIPQTPPPKEAEKKWETWLCHKCGVSHAMNETRCFHCSEPKAPSVAEGDEELIESECPEFTGPQSPDRREHWIEGAEWGIAQGRRLERERDKLELEYKLCAANNKAGVENAARFADQLAALQEQVKQLTEGLRAWLLAPDILELYKYEKDDFTYSGWPLGKYRAVAAALSAIEKSKGGL
jgi:hypothetical protein